MTNDAEGQHSRRSLWRQAFPSLIRGSGEKTAAIWLFTALLSGALGAEGSNAAAAVNRLTEDAWDSITDSMDPGLGGSRSGSHGGVLAEEVIHSLFH